MDESKRIEYPQGTEIFKAQFLLQQIIERLQGESKKPWSSDPNICNMETIRNNINEKIKQTIIKYKIAEDPSVRLSPGWNVMYYDDTSKAIRDEKKLTEIITSLKASQNFRDNVEDCDGKTTIIKTIVSSKNGGRKMRKSSKRHRKSNKKHRKGNKKHKKSIKKHRR